MKEVVWCLLLWVVTVLLVRVCLVVPVFQSNRTIKLEWCDPNGVNSGHLEEDEAEPLECFVFLGSGGHTGEMLRLLEHNKSVFFGAGRTVHVGYSDENSLLKFKSKFLGPESRAEVQFHAFHKARDVGSGLCSSVLTVSATLMSSMALVWKIKWGMRGKRNLTLLNGPGTCCVITLWLKLLHLFTFQASRIVYVESLARTNRLSLTGKIVYPLVDEFVVQWPELLQDYPRARYYGILV